MHSTAICFLLFNLYFTTCPAGHLVNFSSFIAKLHVDGYPQQDTIFEFVYFISLVRSVGCFLFSLLFRRVLLASAASWFGCVVVLPLYFLAYLPISFLTVGIFRSLRISSFLTYHGALTIVLSIFDCRNSSLFMWLIVAVPHSGIPYIQIGFIIVL